MRFPKALSVLSREIACDREDSRRPARAVRPWGPEFPDPKMGPAAGPALCRAPGQNGGPQRTDSHATKPLTPQGRMVTQTQEIWDSIPSAPSPASAESQGLSCSRVLSTTPPNLQVILNQVC